MEGRAIPEMYLDLFQKRAFAHIATLMPDGSPHVTPVWVDYDGRYVIVNTARGRQKELNVQRDPRVALDILDPDDPYRYLMIQGRVVEVTEQGADASIDHLAHKYHGVERYAGHRPDVVRVILKIRPEQVVGG